MGPARLLVIVGIILLLGAVGVAPVPLRTTGDVEETPYDTWACSRFSRDLDPTDRVDFRWVWIVEGEVVRDVIRRGQSVPSAQDGWWGSDDTLPAGTPVRARTATIKVIAMDCASDAMTGEAYDIHADVQLDGSGSHDPDGDLLAYDWWWADENGVTQRANGAAPTISLPRGRTVVSLVVDDGQLQSCADTATMTVNSPNTPPSVPATVQDPGVKFDEMAPGVWGNAPLRFEQPETGGCS